MNPIEVNNIHIHIYIYGERERKTEKITLSVT